MGLFAKTGNSTMSAIWRGGDNLVGVSGRSMFFNDGQDNSVGLIPEGQKAEIVTRLPQIKTNLNDKF